MWQVFTSFFLLGWTSFGGPAAHLGYFRRVFVEEKQWLSDKEYGNLVALSQFLPGPGSSQVCFAIGLQRAGILGAIAAFVAFTLPSFILMSLFAYFQGQMADQDWLYHVISGLKIVAVVVVFDAVLGMYKAFCKEKHYQLIAAATAVALLVMTTVWAQIGVLFAAAVIGVLLAKPEQQERKSSGFSLSLPLLAFVVLFGLSFIAFSSSEARMFFNYFQAGSLVFGGGHVVLPLLQSMTTATVDVNTFLSGYAAAQAIPGPMFTFATFLGFVEHSQSPWLGASIATLAIFLPGFLLMAAFLPSWQKLSEIPKVAAGVAAINAAVVGLLFSALYQPIFTSAVTSAVDMAWVLVGIVLLRVLQWPILAVIALAVASALMKLYLL